jgi:hypothetical protein
LIADRGFEDSAPATLDSPANPDGSGDSDGPGTHWNESTGCPGANWARRLGLILRGEHGSSQPVVRPVNGSSRFFCLREPAVNGSLFHTTLSWHWQFGPTR